MIKIRVKVTAGARKERFTETDKGHFVFSVKEKAERNEANKRVRELVAAHFGVSITAVRIITGHRSPNKVFSVHLWEQTPRLQANLSR